MVVGLIGTTITPWMQFYLQASVVEKGITKRQYSLCRWDVIIGCIITDVVAFFIVLACAATLHVAGFHNISDAADAAAALRPLAGQFAYILFAVGLINASLLSAAILPLATAYNVCEGLGFESGVNKRFSEAPVFYWLYTLLIAVGAGVVLVPRLAVAESDSVLAGDERRAASFRPGLHADAGQSQGTRWGNIAIPRWPTSSPGEPA